MFRLAAKSQSALVSSGRWWCFSGKQHLDGFINGIMYLLMFVSDFLEPWVVGGYVAAV